jgi:hypothetical protein
MMRMSRLTRKTMRMWRQKRMEMRSVCRVTRFWTILKIELCLLRAPSHAVCSLAHGIVQNAVEEYRFKGGLRLSNALLFVW